MVDEAEPDVAGTIGLDPNKTILWAQAREGQPQMSIDIEGRLRPAGIKGNSTVYLGDVARAALRSLGPADPPHFDSEPGYDEQRWTFSTSAGDVTMVVFSDSYWGFGLLARCFLNRIEITGPLALRARIVHDIAATLGRNPWEPSWSSRFEKRTSATLAEHRIAWEGLIHHARDEMNEEITLLSEKVAALRGSDDIALILDEAEQNLDEARAALADHNAPAVERALARAVQALVEADPTTEVRSSETAASGSGIMTWWDKTDEREEVEASHLLEDEVPLVDLTGEE
ncbi:MAG: hypothetical protein MK169_01045 [Candidatus Thalassarchaeum sp.]|nr:hypothetical protein [Candidatus Thalassarchaeum sp.]MEC9351169.1 hypothetical protein [Candidatus Thermoplasmatota archaeon]